MSVIAAMASEKFYGDIRLQKLNCCLFSHGEKMGNHSRGKVWRKLARFCLQQHQETSPFELNDYDVDAIADRFDGPIARIRIRIGIVFINDFWHAIVRYAHHSSGQEDERIVGLRKVNRLPRG